MPTHAAGQPGHDLDLLRVNQQLSPDEVLVRDTVGIYRRAGDAAYRGLVRGGNAAP